MSGSNHSEWDAYVKGTAPSYQTSFVYRSEGDMAQESDGDQIPNSSPTTAKKNGLPPPPSGKMFGGNKGRRTSRPKGTRKGKGKGKGKGKSKSKSKTHKKKRSY
jgi:hypothetical protein